MDFLLVIGSALGISWILGLLLKALIKAPSTVAYHVSGQAERDKQEILETKAQDAKRAIELEKEEQERIERLREAYALEVKSIQNSLKQNDISENSLVVFRKGDSLIVDVAKYDQLYYSASHTQTPSFINAKAFGIKPSHFTTCIRYFVHDPVVSVNVVKNTASVRNDGIRCFDVPEYSIAKANLEFEAIYDEKVYKPLRDKAAAEAEAEKLENLKINAAKDKLNSLFK